MDDPRPATTVSVDDLLELVQWVRRELLLREEAPTGNWVEESALDLRAGRKAGWCYLPSEGGGLAFYSVHGEEAYGHVHVGPGHEAPERARRLSRTMLDALPDSIRSIDVGFTGLPVEDEQTLLVDLATRSGSTIIARRAMERALTAGDGIAGSTAPLGLHFVPIRSVTLEALADLDVRAFRGTVDALLIGRDVADYHRVLETLLAGQLGRFLDEASTALYQPDPPRLIAAILTTEQSAQRAIFVEFMVDPGFRRRGIGSFLLRWGLRALWALGYGRVRLWVTEANEGARKLYERHGFRVTATASIYRWERPGPAPHPQVSR